MNLIWNIARFRQWSWSLRTGRNSLHANTALVFLCRPNDLRRSTWKSQSPGQSFIASMAGVVVQTSNQSSNWRRNLAIDGGDHTFFNFRIGVKHRQCRSWEVIFFSRTNRQHLRALQCLLIELPLHANDQPLGQSDGIVTSTFRHCLPTDHRIMNMSARAPTILQGRSHRRARRCQLRCLSMKTTASTSQTKSTLIKSDCGGQAGLHEPHHWRFLPCAARTRVFHHIVPSSIKLNLRQFNGKVHQDSAVLQVLLMHRWRIQSLQRTERATRKR